ncbi:unnamed protein product, partial [Mesorhabditis spiculigera]
MRITYYEHRRRHLRVAWHPHASRNAHKQHARLLENEIQELNLQLRKAREDIHGLVQMLAEAEAVKTQFRGYLAERSTEAASMRKQINDPDDLIKRADKKRADQLKELLDGLVTRPKPSPKLRFQIEAWPCAEDFLQYNGTFMTSLQR